MAEGIVVDFEADKLLNAIRRIAKDQAPFAIAKGLTMLAKIGREGVRREARKKYNLKTEFIPQGVTLAAARKSDVQVQGKADAWVLTRPRISTFMPAHEVGALKTPGAFSGADDKGRMLAIPGRSLRKLAFRTKTGRVKKRYRVSELLKWYNQLAPEEAARRRGSRKRFAPRPAFIVRARKSGQLLVVRRASPKRRRPLEVLYVLVPQARIPKTWEFASTVHALVESSYKRVFMFTIHEALRTARR